MIIDNCGHCGERKELNDSGCCNDCWCPEGGKWEPSTWTNLK